MPSVTRIGDEPREAQTSAQGRFGEQRFPTVYTFLIWPNELRAASRKFF